MGRKLLTAELTFDDKLLFATAHFESLYQYEKIRGAQLIKSFEIIKNWENSFIMGDFNYDPVIHKHEESNIDEQYSDCLLDYLAGNNNIDKDWTTFPPEDDLPRTRLDRIYRNKKNKYSVVKFELIGEEDIELDNYSRSYEINTPSDHKGIYAEFILN
jgi:endonuclease/exonuclease/phosphatase family metal-dependent hydrolase